MKHLDLSVYILTFPFYKHQDFIFPFWLEIWKYIDMFLVLQDCINQINLLSVGIMMSGVFMGTSVLEECRLVRGDNFF